MRISDNMSIFNGIISDVEAIGVVRYLIKTRQCILSGLFLPPMNT